MNTMGAYRCYLAVRNHFTTDHYDILKHKGKVASSQASLERRKDKYRFEKMAETMTDRQIVETFVSNFLVKPDYSGPFDDQTETRYKKWLAYQQASSYNFGNEVKSLLEDAKKSGLCYNDVFVGSHPPVLTAYLGKQLSVDSFTILNRLNSFIDQMGDDIVMRAVLRIPRKYDPFLKVDMEVYGKINERIRDDVYS